MTQTERILDYCKTHDGLTTLEASDRLRVCRLSERIRELEAKGYSFSHTPEHTENGARVIRYRLLGREYKAPPPQPIQHRELNKIMEWDIPEPYKAWMR